MTTLTLGQSVKTAFRFVQRILSDSTAMLKSLEEDMGKKGWKPTRKLILSFDPLGPTYRIYVPAGTTGVRTSRAGALNIIFDPPDAYEEPVVLIAALSFPKPTSYDDLWNHWISDGSERVLNALLVQNGPMALSSHLLKPDFFPDASDGTAFTLPLCDLSSEEDLRQKIVNPLLTLLK